MISTFYPLLLTGMAYAAHQWAGGLFFYFLALIGAGTCLTQAWCRLGRFFKNIPWHSYADVIVAGVSFLFLAVFTYLAVSKFHAFTTEMVDFGNMDQAIWNTTQGRLLEATQLHAPYANASRLSIHVEFVYLVLSSVYAALPHAQVLFFLHTLALAVSIALFYLIALEILGGRTQALILTLCFSLFPALHFIALFDVHGEIFGLPFLLASYYYYLKKRFRAFFVTLGLALLCKEYIALAVMGYGLALVLKHKDRLRGYGTMGLGLGYFLFAMYGVIPLFNDGQQSILIGGAYGDIGGGGGLTGILLFALQHPVDFAGAILTRQNLENTFYLFFPLMFLVFLEPIFLLGAAPILLKDWLFGMDIYNHHLAPALPFLFIGLCYSIKKWQGKTLGERITAYFRSPLALYLLPLCATLLACFVYGPSPLGHRFWREANLYRPTERDALLQEFVDKIPEEAVISTSGHLAPHLTHRQFCYVFPRPYRFENIDYILLDTLNHRSRSWDSPQEVKAWIPALADMGFTLEEERDGIILFKQPSLKYFRNQRASH